MLLPLLEETMQIFSHRIYFQLKTQSTKFLKFIKYIGSKDTSRTNRNKAIHKTWIRGMKQKIIQKSAILNKVK